MAVKVHSFQYNSLKPTKPYFSPIDRLPLLVWSVCLCSLLCCHLCRIAVFSVTVFYDERIVIVAEQRPDASEEDSFQWMSRVLQVNHVTSFAMFFGICCGYFRHQSL